MSARSRWPSFELGDSHGACEAFHTVLQTTGMAETLFNAQSSLVDGGVVYLPPFDDASETRLSLFLQHGAADDASDDASSDASSDASGDASDDWGGRSFSIDVVSAITTALSAQGCALEVAPKMLAVCVPQFWTWGEGEN